MVCPIDYTKLSSGEKSLICMEGHHFPYIDEVPIMLLPDAIPTHVPHFTQTREMISKYQNDADPRESPKTENLIDPYVQREVAATCGTMYKNLIGHLKRYPIPRLPLSNGSNKVFLDIGCNWGRWCISAASDGFFVVGIDPSFKAIQAAKRVSRQLGVNAIYLVADARYLPFAANCFDVIFSYSVLQHFDKNDAKKTIMEVRRLLKPSGFSLIQMLNFYGIRNQYNMLKRNFREPVSFEVRYWTPSELKKKFSELIGPTSTFVDGFFSANVQMKDIDLLSFPYKCVISISQFLKTISRCMPFMNAFADSLYLKSQVDPCKQNGLHHL